VRKMDYGSWSFPVKTDPEAFRGRNEFGMGGRDTQLTTDESLRACVDNLLSWDDESARSGTSLG